MHLASEQPKGVFDTFADRASRQVSHAWFFCLCVFVVLIWSPTLFLLEVNASQLIINTTTTIVTFLMVALLENSTQRFEDATNHKLNAIADALADLTEAVGCGDHAKDLREAVGIEESIGA